MIKCEADMKNANRRCGNANRMTALFALAAFMCASAASRASSFYLEGQNRGDTNTWSTGNLQNWRELDFIPCRVRITGGPVSSQTVTITFPHLTGTTPGFENLYSFIPSANVVFLSPPTLAAPAAGVWSYTFTVKVTSSTTATVQFYARLAAGAHLNTGSSLMLSGSPSSLGQLQIHKPAPGPGAPNLAIVKSGPTNATPGELVTYTLVYTNKATGTNIARGAQISDILPPQLIPVTNTLNGGRLAGNTIFWDLNDVPPGAGGAVSFQARIAHTAAIGQSITNFAQVLSAEDDANYADNASSFITTVTCFPAVDVMLVIDRSRSMQGKPYSDARLACSNFVHNLKFSSVSTPSDQAGLASYNSTASLDQQLTNNLAALEQAIAAIPPADGYTSISAGLLTAQGELASARHHPGAMPVIVLLSDGVPTGSDTPSNALYHAALAKNAGTRIFTVGLGKVDSALMAGIASSTNDYYYATNSSELVGLFNAISTVICRPPTNIFGPFDQTVCPGTTVEFTVTAAGCDTFTYQWRKNGVNLTGQTGNTLVLPNVTGNDAGVYSVVVDSPCKTVTNHATLTVNTNVSAIGPVSQTQCAGGSVLFTTTVAGTGPITYQWFRDGQLLTNEIAPALALDSISLADAGNYSVVVSGACGAPVTNTASLTVTPLPVITCPPSHTVEFGAPWSFGTPTANYPIVIVSTVTNAGCGNTFTATRTWQATDACGNTAQCSQTVTVIDTTAPTLTCVGNKTVECGAAWSFDAPTASDGTLAILSTVTNALCGQTYSATRTWTATDACGNVSQCSQTVTVVDTTAPALTCAANKTVEAGSAWSFDAPSAVDTCGTNAISIVSTVTNAGCGNTFSATRTWQATDACGNTAQCSQTVFVLDRTAPMVGITSPTNGAQFIAPANITVVADAYDLGGTIAKVEFFAGTNKFSEATNGAPYVVGTNGLPAGNYVFTALATDACGNASTSAPVSVIVLDRPPLTIISALAFNPQTGLLEQKVRVFNPTLSEYQAVRVYAGNLTNGVLLWNKSGVSNNVPYVQSNDRILPGTYVDLTLEYYVPNATVPQPVLRAELVEPLEGGGAATVGVGRNIVRAVMLSNGTFLLEFDSVSNAIYYVQYCSDLRTWKTAQPSITGTGTRMQWVDNGQPKTESAPGSTPMRFYRVIAVQ